MIEGSSDPSVCVALVTYNRKHLLLECLDALLQQTRPVQAILIVDNGSTDGTAELLEQRGYLAHPHVQLLREPTNTGGAGGFYRGLQLGQQGQFDWIWLMDDDAEPAPNALEQALAAAQDPRIAAIANYKVSREGIPQNNHMLLQSGVPADRLGLTASPVPLSFSSFVGLLVRGSAVAQAGLPRAEFFLNQDDTEYCIRLRQVGPIVLVPGSIIRHKEAARTGYVTRSFLGIRHARAPFRAFAFRYFELRNSTVIYRLQHGATRTALFAVRRSLALLAAIACFRDDHALQRCGVVWKAHWDGLTRNFDNSFPFRLLRRVGA